MSLHQNILPVPKVLWDVVKKIMVQSAHQWYKYNQATQNCQCIPLTLLVCDGEYAHTDIQHILTYNDDKNIITEIKMKHQYLGGYNKTDEGYHVLLLPNIISELNQYMCDPLNRKDYMCST